MVPPRSLQNARDVRLNKYHGPPCNVNDEHVNINEILVENRKICGCIFLKAQKNVYFIKKEIEKIFDAISRKKSLSIVFLE